MSDSNDVLICAIDLTSKALERLSADRLTTAEVKSTVQFCEMALGEFLTAIRPIVTESPDPLIDPYAALRSIKASCGVAVSQFELRGSDADFVNELFENLSTVFSTTIPMVVSIIVDLRAQPDRPRPSPSIN